MKSTPTKALAEAPNPGHFHHYVDEHRRRRQLILQPRLGFSDTEAMRQALQRLCRLSLPRVGTITVDSYTRTVISPDFSDR